ncbi:hypothetical protein BDZ94DRAFT_1327481 [Collybia nuda]|uniref:Uncharacterized protein n=1 Tax=Collybia nuda TaxID=64659 RepID=A0A9P6CC04_9AGAR|nr:hypothetical protein BDZ94DRAFT_1327481 [Collybia nuda]
MDSTDHSRVHGTPDIDYPKNVSDITYSDHPMPPYYRNAQPPGYAPSHLPYAPQPTEYSAYPQYGYPQYNCGPGNGPQVGGGDYHHHLRPTIKLSPHAPKSVQRATQHRAEAIAKEMRVDHLAGLDAAAMAAITSDRVPTPSGSPSPDGWTPPPHVEAPSPNVGAIPEPDMPTPQCTAPSVEHLFTPVPAPARRPPMEPDSSIRDAALNAMGFEPFKIPPPPPISGNDMSNKVVNEGNTDETGGMSDMELSEDNDNAGNEHVKKGRPSKTAEAVATILEDRVNRLFKDASRDTRRPVAALVEHWHNTSKYGIKSSPWNDYQYYFKKNMQKERAQAGLPDGDAKACWQTFKTKANYQQIMAVSLELEQATAQDNMTIAQRQKAFKKLSDAYESLANKALRKRVETFIFMAGNSVNEDSNLTCLFTSEGLETFTMDKLRMTSSEFTALAKTQIYSHVSETFINNLAIARGNQPPSLATKLPPPDTKPQPLLNGEDNDVGEDDDSGNDTDNHVMNPGGMVRSVDDDWNEIKKRFKKLFRAHGLTVTTFPWKNLLGQLLKWRVQIIGWPTKVPFPSETVTFDEKRGKKRLSQALMDPAEPIQIISGMLQKDLEQEREPLIVCGAPPYGSRYHAGRRQFAGGRIDHRGPPAVGPSPAATKIKKAVDKKIAGKPPPPDAEIVDILTKSSPLSARTRSRSNQQTKSKIVVDSENETDDDDVPLVPSTSAVHQRSPTPAVDAESNDSDPEGANAIDPQDADFKQPDDNQSEGEVTQKVSKRSPKKVAKGKGKVKPKNTDDGRQHPVETAPHRPKESAPLVATSTVATAIVTGDKRLSPRIMVAASITSWEARIRRAIESLGQPVQGIQHSDEPIAKRPRLDGVTVSLFLLLSYLILRYLTFGLSLSLISSLLPFHSHRSYYYI